MADDWVSRVSLPHSAAGVLDCGAAESFVTRPMDVALHATLDVGIWRARIAGSRTRVVIRFEQSDDQIHWVSGGGADVDEDAQVQRVVAVGRRWFRAWVDCVAPDSSTRWTERSPRRADALDLSENGRTMLALRAAAVGRREPPPASD